MIKNDLVPTVCVCVCARSFSRCVASECQIISRAAERLISTTCSGDRARAGGDLGQHIKNENKKNPTPQDNSDETTSPASSSYVVTSLEP